MKLRRRDCPTETLTFLAFSSTREFAIVKDESRQLRLYAITELEVINEPTAPPNTRPCYVYTKYHSKDGNETYSDPKLYYFHGFFTDTRNCQYALVESAEDGTLVREFWFDRHITFSLTPPMEKKA